MVTLEASDVELLQAWKDGDQGAGSGLFDRHFSSLYRFFANKVDGDADDLIQNTFLKVTERIEQFRGESSFRTYLFVIARRQLADHWREHFKSGRPSRVDDLSLPALNTSLFTKMARDREQQLLLRALRRLPLDLQIIIELHHWEELSGPQLAEVLGIPEGTVRSRLRRAVEKLQEALKKEAASDEAQVLQSTLDGFDGWVRSLRQCQPQKA